MDSGSLFHFSGHCGIRDFRWFISISVSHTVTSRQPGFDLPLLNRFRRRKWRLSDTDLCPCGETQTMSHIVESCPLTKLNGGLSRLHSADEDSVSWLTNYGKWHAYEKKTSRCLRYLAKWLTLISKWIQYIFGAIQIQINLEIWI